MKVSNIFRLSSRLRCLLGTWSRRQTRQAPGFAAIFVRCFFLPTRVAESRFLSADAPPTDLRIAKHSRKWPISECRSVLQIGGMVSGGGPERFLRSRPVGHPSAAHCMKLCREGYGESFSPFVGRTRNFQGACRVRSTMVNCCVLSDHS